MGQFSLAATTNHQMRFSINAVDIASTVTTANYDVWVYWAGVYDGTKLSLYRNGVFDKSGGGFTEDIRIKADEPITRSMSVFGGGVPTYGGRAHIGEAWVFNSALSAVDVKGLYDLTAWKYGIAA